MLHESLGIRDQVPGDPWIHFINGCFDVCLFLTRRNDVLLKIITEFLQSAICLFRMTEYPIKKRPVPTELATVTLIKVTSSMHCYLSYCYVYVAI